MKAVVVCCLFLGITILVSSVPACANEVQASQWVIFDGNNSTEIYGNPSYKGAIGAPYVPGKQVDMMYYGLNNVIGLTSDLMVFGWGSDPMSMGLPAGPTVWLPTALYGGVAVRAAASSAYAAVLVNSTGYVMFSGRLGGMASMSSWTTIGTSGPYPDLVDVKCGFDHCICQSSSGELYGFGANDVNQVQPVILAPAPTAITSLYHLPLSNSAVKFCTGHSHTSIITSGPNYVTLGDCRAVRGCSASLGAIEVRPIPPVNTAINPLSQLECGMFHTVIKFGPLVFTVGANDVSQVNPGAPSIFNNTFSLITTPYFGSHSIVVVGNTTIGKSAITGLIVGFGGATAANHLIASALNNSDYTRPPWLRILTVDAGAGTPLRYTFAVRFRESDTCLGDRPFSDAVCLPTANPTNGRWAAQRPLQLGMGRRYAQLALSGRPMTVYGDFIVSSNGSLSFNYPTDPDSPSLQVIGCAQIDGAVQLSLTSDDLQNIRKHHGGKKSIQLIQSDCPFFASSKREVEVVLKEEDWYSSPASAPESGDVPDVAAEPTETAKSGSSTTTAVVASSAPTSKSSSCSKAKVSTQQQSSGGQTTLVAIVSVDSSGCNTWWIILASVLGGVALIVIIVLIVVFSVPKIRYKILPYRGS